MTMELVSDSGPFMDTSEYIFEFQFYFGVLHTGHPLEVRRERKKFAEPVKGWFCHHSELVFEDLSNKWFFNFHIGENSV